MVDADHVSERPEHQVKTVLVVEDDADIGEFLIELLKMEESFQTLLATNGSQALELVKTVIPDLFVLDYQLPGIDGLSLADHFQAIDSLKEIPILFMSAKLPAQELEKRQIVSLEKPFEANTFLQLVKRLLALEVR